MIRAMRTAGTVLAYLLMAVLVIAVSAADLYVLFHFGFFVWMFVTPVALGLVWLVFVAAASIVYALGSSVVWLARTLTPGHGSDNAD